MFYFVKELVFLQHSNAKRDVIDFYTVVWNNPEVLICVFSVEVFVLCTWRCTDFLLLLNSLSMSNTANF